MTTSLKLPKTAKLSSEDAARTLGKLLLRAKTFESPAIAVVEFPSEPSRKSAVDALEVYLSNTDDTLTDVDLRQPINLLETVSKLQLNKVASIHGLHAQPEVVGQLNWGRERLTDANKRVVLWLNPEESKDLICRAPDFWRFRNRHLVLAPFAENKDSRHLVPIYYQNPLSLSNLSAKAKEDRIDALEELLKSIEDPKSARAQSLRGDVAQLYWVVGKYEQAIKHYRRALEISREEGDKQAENANLGNLGSLYGNLGEVQKAMSYYQQALEISREIGDKQNESIWLGNIGNTYMDIGDIEGSIEKFKQALEISREIGDVGNQGNQLGNLATAYNYTGGIQNAINTYYQALAISRELGDKRHESSWLCNLGNIYSDLGEVHKAIEHHQGALKIDKEIGDRQGESTNLGNLGRAYSNLGEPHKAIEYYHRALKISRELGDIRREGLHLSNLGGTYKDLGQTQITLAIWLLSLSIFRNIHSSNQQTLLRWLTEFHLQKSDFDTLLRNLFPSGDIILNKATGQTYTFFKDAPPDMPDQILELLDEYEKDNPQS